MLLHEAILTTVSPVAVLAFKTALQFELTRRQNDKQIMLIQVKMNDMFSVLLMCASTSVALDDPFRGALT